MAVTPIHLVQQASADKAANTSTPDVPFNQVLSNEIAQHQHLEKSGKNADQKHLAGTNEPADKLDAKLQPADTPQIPAEMLAMLGNLQPIPTEPQGQTIALDDKQDSKQDGKQRLADNSSPQISAEMLAMAGNLHPASPAPATTTEITDASASPASPVSASQAAAGLMDKLTAASKSSADAKAITDTDLTADSKSLPIPADIRPDAKFTAMLKDAEAMNGNPRSARLENDIGNMQTQVQSQPLTTPVQLSAIDMAQSMAGQVTDKLTPRVGTPAWDQALGQKIVWMTGGASQSASLSLNPPDLGPLQVVLNVTNDQANATFIAAQPEVRLAIEAALPKLREMMSDAGIQLGQANVSADTANQRGSQPDSRASRHSNPITEITTDNVNIPRKITTGQGLVNTFV